MSVAKTRINGDDRVILLGYGRSTTGIEMTRQGGDFDFDDWAALAKDDPVEFERRREAATTAMINSATPANRNRLAGLQWQVDMERRRARTPMAACVCLNRLMLDKLYTEFVPLMSRLRDNGGAASEGVTAPAPAGSADIIPLHSPPRQH